MNKTYEKKFEYKGQMVNYFNKVNANPKIERCACYFSHKDGCYKVEWTYKK